MITATVIYKTARQFQTKEGLKPFLNEDGTLATGMIAHDFIHVAFKKTTSSSDEVFIDALFEDHEYGTNSTGYMAGRVKDLFDLIRSAEYRAEYTRLYNIEFN